MVLMEDANGERIFLTEGLPSEKHFKVGKYAEAKEHVGEAKRGAAARLHLAIRVFQRES